jgi:hypothetical protein
LKCEIELLKTQLLPDFPSGSSINHRDGLLYLVGDDSNVVLILDKDYLKAGTLQLFNYPGKRIPKSMKADVEASVFITVSAVDYLLILGSAATTRREKIILIPFSASGLNKARLLTVSTQPFTNRLRSLGLPEINLEGATAIGEALMVANRGNRKNTTNHILFTNPDFWNRQDEADIKIIPIEFPSPPRDVIGISELCYEKETDTLLMSFSSEHTDNAYDDGTIGDSYIGWIQNMTKKINAPSLVPEHIINLSSFHPEFVSEKIEGLCVESVRANEMIVHLISDNDKGQSKLFKVRLKIRDQRVAL